MDRIIWFGCTESWIVVEIQCLLNFLWREQTPQGEVLPHTQTKRLEQIQLTVTFSPKSLEASTPTHLEDLTSRI